MATLRTNTMPTRVLVTGAGVVSSLGLGREALWQALLSGQTGVAPISSFDPEGLGRTIAAEVRDFRPRDHLTAAEARRMGRCSAYCVAAARMALADAGLGLSEGSSADRTAVVLGTTMGEAG